MNSLYTNEQLTELYEQTQPSVYAVVYSIVKNEQDALDLTQDAYISAFTNIEKINDIKKFDKWVIQIAANKCKDFLRKKKPTLFSQVGEQDEDFEKDIPDSSDAYNPDVLLESKEKKDIIKNILYSLPEDQRLCLVLYYGQELKISEIATALDISENTVKSRLTYGKKKMKEQVEELERKGTKLHGIAGVGILPLIRQLFASNSIASPPAGVLSATELLAKATQGANVVKQATSISKVFAKVTSIVTKNLATKIISATVATAVVATGAVAVIKPDLFSKNSEIPQINSEFDNLSPEENPIILVEEPFAREEGAWIAYIEDNQYLHGFAFLNNFESDEDYFSCLYFNGKIFSKFSEQFPDATRVVHDEKSYLLAELEEDSRGVKYTKEKNKITITDNSGNRIVLKKVSKNVLEVTEADAEFGSFGENDRTVEIKVGTKFTRRDADADVGGYSINIWGEKDKSLSGIFRYPLVGYIKDDDHMYVLFFHHDFEHNVDRARFYIGSIKEDNATDANWKVAYMGKTYSFYKEDEIGDSIDFSQKDDKITIQFKFHSQNDTIVLQKTSENEWEVISEDTEFVEDTSFTHSVNPCPNIPIKKGTKFEWKYSAFE